jgi:hypothetical protein
MNQMNMAPPGRHYKPAPADAIAGAYVPFGSSTVSCPYSVTQTDRAANASAGSNRGRLDRVTFGQRVFASGFH